MGKKRYIDTKFWSDPWVIDELEPLDRYVFMYLMTNDKTNIAGIYEIPMRTICSDTGLSRDEIERILQNLSRSVEYVGGWIVLKNAAKHQSLNNPKIRAGFIELLRNCPQEVIHRVNLPSDIKYEVIDKETEVEDSSCIGYTRPIDSQSHLYSNLNLNSNNNKDNTKVLGEAPKYGKSEINYLFDFWNDTLGYEITSKQKANRYACNNLIKKHGVDGVEKLIRGVAMAAEDEYAPRVSDFTELQGKMNNLIAWGKRQSTNMEIVEI